MRGGKLPDVYLALVDKYGNIVGSDSESIISVVFNSSNEETEYRTLIEGTSTYKAENGMFIINDLFFTSEPGTNHTIKFTSTGIDSSKPSNQNLSGTTDIHFTFYVELRECIAGEYYSKSGK